MNMLYTFFMCGVDVPHNRSETLLPYKMKCNEKLVSVQCTGMADNQAING